MLGYLLLLAVYAVIACFVGIITNNLFTLIFGPGDWALYGALILNLAIYIVIWRSLFRVYERYS